MTSPCASALEISSRHTDDDLRLQDLETCRWRREFLDVWTTGNGRMIIDRQIRWHCAGIAREISLP
jgi:hypothetical protein